MTTNRVETLDDKLRQRAQARLKQEIGRALAPVREIASYGCTLPRSFDHAGKEKSVRLVLDEIESVIYSARRQTYEEDEIRDFLRECDDFRTRLNELEPQSV